MLLASPLVEADQAMSERQEELLHLFPHFPFIFRRFSRKHLEHIKYFLIFAPKTVKETFMMTAKTTINPIQLHLLEMFKYCDSEQMMADLKDCLAEFYAKQVQSEADRLWAEGSLNADAIEKILNEHWRTPYKTVK